MTSLTMWRLPKLLSSEGKKKKIVSFFQAEQIEITQSLQQASKTWIELDLQIVIHSLEGKSMLSGCWVFYSFLAALQSIHFHLYWYLFITLFLKEKIYAVALFRDYLRIAHSFDTVSLKKSLKEKSRLLDRGVIFYLGKLESFNVFGC